MVNFADPELVSKYGSWIRVQVAFYDFLFTTAMQVCSKHGNQALIADAQERAAAGEWADGGDLYEDTIRLIELTYASPEEAWRAFVSESTPKADE